MNNEIRFCAEIGSNHNGSLPRCLSLIHTAKAMGCFSVKFQLFKGDQLYKNAPKEIVDDLKRRELPIPWLPTIKAECKRANIKFGCTPFYLEAIDILKPYVDFLKISSFDTKRLDLIERSAKTKLPLMVSLGLIRDRSEICDILKIIIQNGIKPIFFHCVSQYPTLPENANLYNIITLQHILGDNEIGWSDHTREPSVIYQAIGKGVNYIEFHLDAIDNQGWENHGGHCWNSTEMSPIIKTARIMYDSMGYDNMDFFNCNKGSSLELRADEKTGLRDCIER